MSYNMNNTALGQQTGASNEPVREIPVLSNLDGLDSDIRLLRQRFDTLEGRLQPAQKQLTPTGINAQGSPRATASPLSNRILDQRAEIQNLIDRISTTIDTLEL